MTGLMNAVYQALKGMPCAVSRAWPQAAQGLPAVTFSLLDCQGGSAGLARAQIRVSARAALPEEADALAVQAAGVLEPLGLRLSGAKDEAEADTGAFLKILVLEGMAWDGLPQKLRLSVMDSGAWVPVAGLQDASFTAGERTYRDVRPLSADMPIYAAGEPRPAALKVTAQPDPSDPGQRAISQAFQSGTKVNWRLEGGGYTQSGFGLVAALSGSALGFSAQIMITG
ncbi:MAG: hypothetical protein PHP02_06050 [Eubacteriales bacterium]|nr:hypothetical protein [Eubacteriales bacterium]